MTKAPTKEHKETREFQAETKQLLDLMVHSVYTNREIFLRELISNASDAIDKIRFQSLTNLELLENDPNFEIWLEVDENNHTLTISDNGMGMTYDEVIENIGTIAKSGTKSFLEKLQNKDNEETTLKDNLELIGQFGVGFYSAFMVSDKVTLLTRAPGQSTGVKWESTGDGTYTIEEAPKEKRGTSITLTINEEYRNTEKPEENFLNRYTLQNLVKKYSDYIRYPIKMNFIREEKPRDKEGKIIEGAAPSVTIETKTLNSMTPIWARPKSEITNEEYQQFYKNLFHDWNEPLDIIHTKVEGAVEYTALLFIPSHAPYDFYSRDYHYGIKLYSRNVFIMDNCQDLLPEHLRFVRGLVDSADFSLNISREILQHSKQLKLIGKNLEKSILKALENMLEKDRKKYETFWGEFGKAIKGGIYMDYQSREKLQGLLLFPSSYSADGYTTLDEYIGRMKEKQSVIYYAAGKDRAMVEKLPQMELLREKGYEVLYFFDRVDEFAIDALREYKEKKFQSVSRGDLKLDDEETENKEEKSKKETVTKENESLIKAIKEHLGSKVSDVRISHRLKSSAVCLVSGDAGISISMENILSEMNQSLMRASRILELNPDHEVFHKIKSIYNADPKSETFKEYSDLLYEQAMLMEGLQLEDPVGFANRVAKLMAKAG
ncbi:MAG: molecular chaperone HtpG [Firmicutes bacterium]|nr:molecular chaperone HtpG [Bacillota bacterium]